MTDTTIVNTPATRNGSGAGWAIAIIVILAVIAGGFAWYRYYGFTKAPSSAGTTNINVTLPAVPDTGITNTTAESNVQ